MLGIMDADKLGSALEAMSAASRPPALPALPLLPRDASRSRTLHLDLIKVLTPILNRKTLRINTYASVAQVPVLPA